MDGVNTMDKKLVSYVDAMYGASEVIDTEKPDHLVAPMTGSVPFIDVMAIVNPDFDVSKVVYMPASSRIENIGDIIKTWYYNFLSDAIDFPNHFPKIMGIDEVVSGNSLVHCFKHIDRATNKKRSELRQDLVERLHTPSHPVSASALRDADMLTRNQYAPELSEMKKRILNRVYESNRELAKKNSKEFVEIVKGALESKIVYSSMGIEDSKNEGKRNSAYRDLRELGRVNPISVESILTMDKPDLCPIRFEELEKKKDRNYVAFSPKVKDFLVTPQYVDFLRDIARYIGKNPDEVSPVNMAAILDSSKYLNGYANKQ